MSDIILSWALALGILAWLALEFLGIMRFLRRVADKLTHEPTPDSVQVALMQIDNVNVEHGGEAHYAATRNAKQAIDGKSRRG
jgi:hypothetical protein